MAKVRRQLAFDFEHETVEWHTIDALVAEMTAVYLRDDRPWVVGYSGGKDSGATVSLVYRTLMALPPVKRTKHVYIVSSDTLVENPRVKDWLDKCHAELRQVAADYALPVTIVKVVPDEEESFWVCLIGKGYPAPTSEFRWCTSRLKIDPAESWVREHIAVDGRILQLLGSRKKESKRREQSIEAHALEQDNGTKLKAAEPWMQGLPLHKFGTTGSLTLGFSYQPIVDWDNDNVWEFLRGYPKPWEPGIYDHLPMEERRYNQDLFDMYQDAHAGECVLDFDKRTASCGGSRFGCWTCTVVPEDKSMTNMVGFSNPEFEPLLVFRQKIKDYRSDWDKRELRGRNGRLRFMATLRDADGNALYGPFITPGPYKLEIRAELLRELFRIERALPGFKTVTDTDLHWIRHHWEKDYGAGALVDQVRTEVAEEAA